MRLTINLSKHEVLSAHVDIAIYDERQKKVAPYLFVHIAFCIPPFLLRGSSMQEPFEINLMIPLKYVSPDVLDKMELDKP